MLKKVEKIVFSPKRLYEAKNGQISKTPHFLTHAGKKKHHPKNGAF
jgi:hypothetical protein